MDSTTWTTKELSLIETGIHAAELTPAIRQIVTAEALTALYERLMAIKATTGYDLSLRGWEKNWDKTDEQLLHEARRNNGKRGYAALQNRVGTKIAKKILTEAKNAR